MLYKITLCGFWQNMDRIYECLHYDGKYGREIETFWVSGVALCLVGFFGVVGNVLSMVIILRSSLRKKVFNQLLAAMAFFDTLYIVSTGIEEGHYGMVCWENYKGVIPSMLYPYSNIGLLGSIYSTVMVSLERYLGMCYPFLKYRRNIWIYVITIVVVAFFYSLPRFFDVQFYIMDGSLYARYRTWNNESYRRHYYYGWARILVEDIIPLPIIIVLNTMIMVKVRKAPKISETANAV